MHCLSPSTRLGQFAAVAALALTTLAPAWANPRLPEIQSSAPVRPASNLQTAVFAGGCFWGVDAVFKHVKGVSDAESGYVGGRSNTADYEQVSGGATGHAEAVRVRFDPSQVSYPQLLQVFFSVAHDHHPPARRCTHLRQTHRHATGTACAVLPGRGVSPELPGIASSTTVYRLQRHAQIETVASTISSLVQIKEPTPLAGQYGKASAPCSCPGAALAPFQHAL